MTMSNRITIQLRLTGKVATDAWETAIETSRGPSQPARLFVIQLPSQVRHPSNCVRHLGGDRYELNLRLEGPTFPAELLHLPSIGAAEMPAKVASVLATFPAVVVIVIHSGRVFVTVHHHKNG